MEIAFLNIGLAFLEGFALILSPCILPILPVILSGSLEGDKKRPLGIIVGFVLTFALFTFFSKKLVQSSGIDLNLIRNISFGLLLFLGIIMISSYLTEKFGQFTQQLANIGATSPTFNNPQGGFISGMLFGSLVGLVWTPCAGPILAAVIVQTVIQKTTLESFLTILAFGIGTAIPLFIIVLFGRTILTKFGFLKRNAILIRKILGAIIIISVLYMIYGDVLTESFSSPQKSSPSVTGRDLKNGLKNPYPAPAIEGIQAWINSKPLQLEHLKGKVVLIDFWAYSCINCIRTLPYLIEWNKKYQNHGLVIIGVHSPEFDFERDVNNVKSAVQKYGILYPVALDNNFKTWQNFNNHYWPAHYLIDKQGRIVYQHFGEGEYDTTENNIRFLLGMDPEAAASNPKETFSLKETPETYLGYARAEQFRSPEAMVKDNTGFYLYPEYLPENGWALRGAWTITPQKIIAAKTNAAIKLHFYAKKVYAVMGNNTNAPITVKIVLNDQKVNQEGGKKIKNNSLTVTQHTLYTILELEEPRSGIVELISEAPGLEVYTFTFGN